MREAERGQIEFNNFSAHGRSDPGERGGVFHRLKIIGGQRASAGERYVFAIHAADGQTGISGSKFQSLQQHKIPSTQPDSFRLAGIRNPRYSAGAL